MRLLNLIPAEVLEARRRSALVRRSGVALAAWAALLGFSLAGAQRWHRDEVRAVQALDSELRSGQERVEALGPLRAERARLASQVEVVQRVETRRPVTGLLSLVAGMLPARLQLENLSIGPASPRRSGAPGSASYFGAPARGTVAVELRGLGGDPDDVAALLRTLESCGRFRRVQLTRLDRQAPAEGKLHFEMHCEL